MTVLRQAANDSEPETHAPSDAALVVAARANEAWAQEALFRRYAPMVNGLAFRLAATAHDADDLAQDAFCEALDSLDRLREPQAFAGWLKTLVVRTASRRLRSYRVRKRFGLVPGAEIDLDAMIAPDAPAEVAQELRAIYSQIEALGTEERVAFLLQRVEGCSVQEISTHMGLSEPSVKRRLRAAEAKLGLQRSPS